MSGNYSLRGNPANDTSFDNVWIRNTIANPSIVNSSAPTDPTNTVFENLTLNKEPLATNNILISDSKGNASWSSTANLTDFTLNKGSPSNGYVLVSDSKGNASWSAPNDFNFKSMRCIAQKKSELPKGVWTTVGTFSGSGVVKRIWLALSTNLVKNIYFQITFDDDVNTQPQVGTDTSSGFDLGNSISCDTLFTAGFDAESPWSNNTSGCNVNQPAALGGYISFDMPFGTNFTVRMFNNNSPDSNYYFWSQIFFTEEVITTPLRFHLKPFSHNPLDNTNTEFKEYSLLSTESKNGVYFAGSKHFIAAGADNHWMEGKIRIYRGGAGFDVNTNNNYTAATPSDLSYYNQLPNVTQIFSSSGFEDYIFSSYSFYGPTIFNFDNAGVVYNTTVNSAAGDKCCYRYFNTGREKSCMPYAPPNTKLVTTFTCGDQNTPISSSMTFMYGWCVYYA